MLHAASSFPLFTDDPSAPFMEEMLSALGTRGHDVTVIVPRVDRLVEGFRTGVEVIGAPYAPRPFQVWGYGRSLNSDNRLRFASAAVTPLAMASMVKSLRSQIRSNRPDVVHLHWVLPQGMLAAAVPADIPVVISVHGADVPFVRGRMKPVARSILKRADALIAASSEVLDAVSEAYPPIRDKSRVIPHGANTDLFNNEERRQSRVELGIDPALPVVLAIGRLVSKKGFDQLIRSMSEIRDIEAHLYIIGDGPNRAKLEANIPDADRRRVHLLGAQPRGAVAKWMAASDVVVIPGVADGMDIDSGPVVLMEALAAGRPVVSTKVGMAPDVVVDNVNGYLIDSSEPQLIASALTRAIASSDRLGQGARRSFENLGGWDRVARDLELLYQELVAVPRQSPS